jgi:hypothetical protein
MARSTKRKGRKIFGPATRVSARCLFIQVGITDFTTFWKWELFSQEFLCFQGFFRRSTRGQIDSISAAFATA